MLAGGSRKPKGRRRGRGVRLREGSRIREPGNDAETEPLASENGQKSAIMGLSSAFNIVRRVSDKMAAKKQGKKIFHFEILPSETELENWVWSLSIEIEFSFLSSAFL